MATNDYDCPMIAPLPIFTGSLALPTVVTDEFDPVFIKMSATPWTLKKCFLVG